MKKNLLLRVLTPLLLISATAVRAMAMDNDPELNAAIAASLADIAPVAHVRQAQNLDLTEEEELQLALAESRQAEQERLQRRSQVQIKKDAELARIIEQTAQEAEKKQQELESQRLANEIAAYEFKGQKENQEKARQEEARKKQAEQQARQLAQKIAQEAVIVRNQASSAAQAAAPAPQVPASRRQVRFNPHIDVRVIPARGKEEVVDAAPVVAQPAAAQAPVVQFNPVLYIMRTGKFDVTNLDYTEIYEDRLYDNYIKALAMRLTMAGTSAAEQEELRTRITIMAAINTKVQELIGQEVAKQLQLPNTVSHDFDLMREYLENTYVVSQVIPTDAQQVSCPVKKANIVKFVNAKIEEQKDVLIKLLDIKKKWFVPKYYISAENLGDINNRLDAITQGALMIVAPVGPAAANNNA